MINADRKRVKVWMFSAKNPEYELLSSPDSLMLIQSYFGEELVIQVDGCTGLINIYSEDQEVSDKFEAYMTEMVKTIQPRTKDPASL